VAGKRMSNEIIKVFNDLDDYLRFCKEFGWAYDEADLYREDAPVYAEYLRFKSGTRIPKNWMRDAKFRLSQYQDNRSGGGKFQSGRRN
jgi:hypothetical protein